MRRLFGFGLAALGIAFAVPAAAQSVGDRVEYFESGWWKGTVVEVGSGANSGEFKVRADGSSFNKWAAARNVRLLPRVTVKAGRTQSAPTGESGGAASGPRAGDYSILSYLNPRNPLRLGRINLSSPGRYRFYNNGNRLLGEGTYSYSAGQVSWKSGILGRQGWGGGFEVDGGGRDHKIRLKSGTIAVNSR